jgi:hypothetical protein
MAGKRDAGHQVDYVPLNLEVCARCNDFDHTGRALLSKSKVVYCGKKWRSPATGNPPLDCPYYLEHVVSPKENMK